MYIYGGGTIVNPIVTVTPRTIFEYKNAVTVNFTVSANVSWYITVDLLPSWMYIGNGSGSSGNTTVFVDLSTNNSGSERSYKIELYDFYGNKLSNADCPITQYSFTEDEIT